MSAKRIEPAPARGCYDRAQSRQARQAEQQERLVHWLALKWLERDVALTVQDVVAAAGVGRNTFYEYFDGLEHALAFAAQACQRRISESIVSDVEDARTPIARLRRLSEAWFARLTSDPEKMALLLRLDHTGKPSLAALLFSELTQRALGDATSPLASATPEAVACAAFAAEGATRAGLRDASRRPLLAEAMTALLTRLFR